LQQEVSREAPKPEDQTVKLGEKIYQARRQKKLTQVELAKLAGINSNHLSRLERGVFQPSAEVLKALADALEVSVDYLLSEGDDGPTEVHVADKGLVERVRLIEQLEPADRDALLRVIDSMLSKEKMKRFLETELAASRG
jgi:transcriptional regulator with XRE-family HTH domain